jgi:transglutaminase-like putative cysteine protease
MILPGSLRLTVYLLVLDGLAAVALTEAVGVPGLIAALAGVGASLWVDRLRGRVRHYRRIWEVLTVAFLVYGVLDAAFLAESLVGALLHLLLFLQIYKLCNLEAWRDLLDVVLLSFLQLLAASTLTVSLLFLPVFSLYMLLALWALIMLHLRRETEAAVRDGGAGTSGSAPALTPHLLLSSGVGGLVSLFLTLLIFFAIPRIGRTYLPLQGPTGPLTTGFAERVRLGAYGSIQQDSTIIMRISLPAEAGPERRPGLRWRGTAFDHFDGSEWRLSDSSRTPVRRVLPDSFSVQPPRPGPPLFSYEVFLEPMGTDVLFGSPRVVALRGHVPPVATNAGGGLVLHGAPAARVRYTVVSQPEPRGEAELGRAGTRYPPRVRETYLQLPLLPPAVHRLSRELVGPAATPYQAARRVEQYLARSLQYSLDLPRTTAADPLEEFLLGRQAGNCEYFAAGMAVLLRAAGIPARVVNGFQRGEWNEHGRYFAVRQRDAHSWVEVYFPGAGWASFDPTPRATYEAARFGSTGWAGKYLDALRMRWNRYVVDYTVTDQAAVALRVREQVRAAGDPVRWAEWSRAAHRALAGAGPGIGLAGVLLAGSVAALRLLRRRAAVGGLWRRLGRRGPAAAPARFYARMLRLLARRGHPRPPTLTPREFAAGLEDHPVLHGPVRELTELYERVRFGGERLTPAEEGRAADLLRRLASRS